MTLVNYDREERLRFIKVDDKTKASLLEVTPLILSNMDTLLDAFYAHIF